MKMKRWAIVAGILAALGLLAGCSGDLHHFTVASGGKTATCGVSSTNVHCSANGRSVTVGPAGQTHKSSVPVADSPSPATPTPSPVTETPTVTATPLPQSSFDANAVSAVQSCVSQFSGSTRDTLVSFSTSADARSNMAVCLQMPPQTVALFLHLLFKYAYAAYVHGDFDTQAGQDNFTGTVQGDTIPHAVIKCDKHYT